MAKKKQKEKDLMAYFGSYLDAIQGSQNALSGLDPITPPVYKSPFRDNPPGAIDKPYGEPFSQSNTMATSAQQDSLMMKNRDFKGLPSDEQQFVKEENAKTKKGSSMPQVDIKSLVGSVFPLINALVGEKDPVRTRPFSPLEVYNPHPLGTGSQAIYKKGGKVKKADMGTMLGDPIKTVAKPQNKLERDYHVYDNVNNMVALGGNPMETDYFSPLLQDKRGKALIDNINIFNNSASSRAMTPQQRLMSYYSTYSNNPDVQSFKDQAKTFGQGAVASYNDSPNTEKINLSHNPQPKKAPLIAGNKKNGGKVKKAFWGAIAGAVGGQAGGSAFGKIQEAAKQQTKLANQAPQEIMNFISQMAQFRDQFDQGGGYTPGPYVQPDQMRYMEGGGSIKGKNQVMLHDEGSTEMLSYNPYDGGTMQLNGPSHAEDGIDMSYGNSRVEAEGGETAVKDVEGNLHIMGNMKVPGSKIKFKTMSKKIAEKEEEYDDIKTKGSVLVNTYSPTNKWDRLKFNSGRVMMEGGDMGQKDLVVKKNELASLQNALLETAQEFNLDPEALSEGRKNKAKKGTFKARGGAVLDGGDPIEDIIAAIARAESNNNYNAKAKGGSSAYGKYQMIEGLRKDLYKNYYKSKYKNFEEFDNAFKNTPSLQDEAMQYRAQELNKKYNGDLKQIVLAHRLGEGGAAKMKRNPSYLNNPISTSIEGSTDKETPNEYLKKVLPSIPNSPLAALPTPKPKPINPYTLPDYPLTYKAPTAPTPDNPDAPPNRDLPPVQERNIPSNVRGLSPAQLIPELLALGSNQLEPVAAQQYMPLLKQPYQVSFQDRLNENQASFNSIQRQLANDPLALSSLSAQQYRADNAVQAEEFRTNQAEANQVYNENRATLNDAQLKNLAIADQQYTRQAQAKSNTKAQNQVIANSISSKYLQNRQNNQKLALYENLYNFRAQDTNADGIDDKMVNYNPDAVYNYGIDNVTNMPEDQRVRTKEDGNGVLKEKVKTTPSAREKRIMDLRIEALQRNKPLISIPKLWNK